MSGNWSLGRGGFCQPVGPSSHHIAIWIFKLCRCFPHSDKQRVFVLFCFVLFLEREARILLLVIPQGPLDSRTARYPGVIYLLDLVKFYFLQKQGKATSDP